MATLLELVHDEALHRYDAALGDDQQEQRLVYLLPRRSWLKVAAEDTFGTAVAALSALTLVSAALWLQHCCRSPGDPTENGEGPKVS